jgi:hypothetical protein
LMMPREVGFFWAIAEKPAMADIARRTRHFIPWIIDT